MERKFRKFEKIREISTANPATQEAQKNGEVANKENNQKTLLQNLELNIKAQTQCADQSQAFQNN